jgi:hypothetical protein
MSGITDRARDFKLIETGFSYWATTLNRVAARLALGRVKEDMAALQRERDEALDTPTEDIRWTDPDTGLIYYSMTAKEYAGAYKALTTRAEKAEASIDTLTKLRALDYTSMVASNARAENAEGEAKALLTDNRELVAQNDAYQSQNTQLRRETKALRAALFRLTASISAHLADALPISCPTCIDALTKARAALQSQGGEP